VIARAPTRFDHRVADELQARGLRIRAVDVARQPMPDRIRAHTWAVLGESDLAMPSWLRPFAPGARRHSTLARQLRLKDIA
jgi:hypothetical protein